MSFGRDWQKASGNQELKYEVEGIMAEDVR